MKLVFASDSFKGTLSSSETAMLLKRAATKVFGQCDTISVNIADGGEGTIDAVIHELDGKKVYVNVHDPLMKEIGACYGLTNDKKAIIEMAQASGLTLVPEDERNPLFTTTYGTGELVIDAIKNGATEIIVAIGGSATNDGGMGVATALGVRFLDVYGNELEGKGINLERVADIDFSRVSDEVKNTKFVVMCDVTNPLCGKNGATFTYAKQKGASHEEIVRLEAGMQNFRDVIEKKTGINPDGIEGSGAAGGLGAALSVFFHAELKSGIETVLDIIDFDDIMKDADFIITGEGKADYQSVLGKVVSGVAKRAKKRNVPVIALCGDLGEGYEKLYDCGVSSIYSITEEIEPGKAMENAAKHYYEKAICMFKDIKMIEAEIKLPLDSDSGMAEKLIEAGFEKRGRVRETDIYFNGIDRDFRKSDEALRIRRVEGMLDEVYTLTYKGPKLDNISMSREETEIQFSDFDAMQKILVSLGFQPVFPVVKEREYYDGKDMTACLDYVNGLGWFLELEVMAEGETEYENALALLRKQVEVLGYKMEDTTRTSYLSMLEDMSC